jgi:hypothetical protein
LRSQAESNANKTCKILVVRGRCSGIERQNVFSSISEKISFVFYCEMKHEWGKESFTDEYTRKERKGIIWLKAGIWKL